MKIRVLSICLIATLSTTTTISAGELLQDFFKTINLPKLNISDNDETPVISTLEAVGEETGKVVNEVGNLLEQLVSPAPTKKEPKADAATPAKIQSDVKPQAQNAVPLPELAFAAKVTATAHRSSRGSRHAKYQVHHTSLLSSYDSNNNDSLH